MKRIAEMVECSHGAVTEELHFYDRTSSDMFGLMVYLWVSQKHHNSEFNKGPMKTY